jgi:hypothetical protein
MTFTESPAEIDKQVERILRGTNIVEPGGDWSVFDVARILDPAARNPESMHDTGKDTWPGQEYLDAARESIARLQPSGRYVGGLTGHLYGITL